MLLTACGGRKTRVSTPAGRPGGGAPTTPARPPAASELSGLASYYAEPYHGRRTASGEIFDTYQELTAAHRTLPFNTLVKVTNLSNGKIVEVRINDRGPFIDGRVIDLSLKAAREIDMVRAGIVPVRLEILARLSPPAAVAAAVPPPLPPGAPPPASVPLYAVQVGAFESEDMAEALRRDLELRYADVSVQIFSSDRLFYRVRVGRSADIGAAEELSRKLEEESFRPFVVRLN